MTRELSIFKCQEFMPMSFVFASVARSCPHFHKLMLARFCLVLVTSSVVASCGSALVTNLVTS